MLAYLIVGISFVLTAITCLFFIQVESTLGTIALIFGVYIIWKIIVSAVILLCLLIVSLFIDKNKPCDRFHRGYYWWLCEIINCIMLFLRVTWEIEGQDKIPSEDRFLLAGNHISNLDPMILYYALRKYDLTFVSKMANLKIPLVGAFLHKSYTLPLEKDDVRQNMKMIIRASELIANNEVSFGIYPEGHRNFDGILTEFKAGSLKIAKKAEVPIVICTVQGTNECNKNFPWKPTKVVYTIEGVIDAETVKAHSTQELAQMVREPIARRLGQEISNTIAAKTEEPEMVQQGGAK